MNPKREQLINLSIEVRELVETGEFETINEAVIELYKETDPGIKEFHTFKQWKESGKKIIKGSKAFVVWARPRQLTKKPEFRKDPQNEDEKYKYWPICYLFSNLQIES